MRLVVEIDHLLDVHDVVLDEIDHVAARFTRHIVVDGDNGVVVLTCCTAAAIFFCISFAFICKSPLLRYIYYRPSDSMTQLNY